jgi:hypothetical protein
MLIHKMLIFVGGAPDCPGRLSVKGNSGERVPPFINIVVETVHQMSGLAIPDYDFSEPWEDKAGRIIKVRLRSKHAIPSTRGHEQFSVTT